LTMEVIYW